jgi:hypothetical protein
MIFGISIVVLLTCYIAGLASGLYMRDNRSRQPHCLYRATSKLSIAVLILAYSRTASCLDVAFRRRGLRLSMLQRLLVLCVRGPENTADAFLSATRKILKARLFPLELPNSKPTSGNVRPTIHFRS